VNLSRYSEAFTSTGYQLGTHGYSRSALRVHMNNKILQTQVSTAGQT